MEWMEKELDKACRVRGVGDGGFDEGQGLGDLGVLKSSPASHQPCEC